MHNLDSLDVFLKKQFNWNYFPSTLFNQRSIAFKCSIAWHDRSYTIKTWKRSPIFLLILENHSVYLSWSMQTVIQPSKYFKFYSFLIWSNTSLPTQALWVFLFLLYFETFTTSCNPFGITWYSHSIRKTNIMHPKWKPKHARTWMNCTF